MTTRWSLRRKGVVAFLVAMAMVLMLTASAFAAGGPPAGRGSGRGGGGGHGGGGGGGHGGGETVANNLSVPAIFVPSSTATGAPALNFACGAAVDPTGAPDTGFDVPGYYYVQGTHKWQTSCATALADDSVHAIAAWGDNLTSASLVAGRPIRVEVGLSAANPVDPNTGADMTGYNTIKLQNVLDRESKYGTLASGPEVNAPPAAKSTPYIDPLVGAAEVRVWDAGSTLTITGPAPVATFEITAEINATGRVVYGFNWTPPAGGTYTLTFNAPTVTLDGTTDNHTVSKTVTVKSS